MANVTIKNVPEELYIELRKRAEENRRSLNSELIVSLEQVVRERPAAYGNVSARPSLDEIRALRSTLHVPPLTEEFLDAAINAGRA